MTRIMAAVPDESAAAMKARWEERRLEELSRDESEDHARAAMDADRPEDGDERDDLHELVSLGEHRPEIDDTDEHIDVVENRIDREHREKS